MSQVVRRCAPMLVVGAILISAVADPAAADPPKRGGKGHAAPAKSATPAKSAKLLVASLQRAHGAKAQQKAMLSVMRKLGIAVYTGSGKALVRRASVARHAFLYDFELAPLVASRARGDRVSVADLAGRLNQAGLHPPGKELTPKALAGAFAASARADLKRPRRTAALPALVLRELGRTDKPKVNIAKLRADSSLDPIQAQLVLVAFAQVVYGSPAGGKASGPSARASSATDVCAGANEVKEAFLSGGADGFGGKLLKKVIKGKLTKKILSESQQKALKKALAIEDAVHGAALALSVSVHGEPEKVGPAHYNHAAGEQNVLQIHIKVEMLDDYGKVAVKCGPLAGIKFPKKGGIPKVPMHWETPKLADHGQVICDAGCKQTGDDGVATLTLVLKSERIPGYGLQQEDTDNADAIADYQSAFGAGLADGSFWAQYITPKYGGVRWFVDYHKEPTLSLRLSAREDVTFTNVSEGVVGNKELTSGEGGGHYAIGSEVPLGLIESNGMSWWAGSAPIHWGTFSFSRQYGMKLCQGAGLQRIDYGGYGPTAGELVVDSVQKDVGAAPADLALTFHAGREPGYTRTTDAFAEDGCPGHSASLPSTWWPGGAFTLAQGGVRTISYSNGPGASPTYRVTGWQPGPDTHGAGGVYAYRDLPYATSAFLGTDLSGLTRLEVVASPAP